MRRKWQEDIEMQRRLRAAGVPLEVVGDDCGIDALPANGLFMTQTGECSVFDLDPCGVGFILELRIVPNFPWPFEISTLELDLPWQDSFLHWLPDPIDTRAKDLMYWFPTSDRLRFPRNQAINHHIGSSKRFSRGCSIGGLLLGVGAFMPDDIRHDSEVPAFVRVFDQFGKRYTRPFSLRASRMSPSRRTRLQQKKATRVPLLACPDPKRTKRPDWKSELKERFARADRLVTKHVLTGQDS
jgi:hypothetical protein